MGEFDLIAQYFGRPAATRAAAQAASPVMVGIGDDCALLQPSPGMHLAISSDMLVEGRHFFADVNPEALGHKALAVNLSDLAACGARPVGFTLALALPEADARWLEGFSRGLFALADAHGCALVGGDTTQGPRNICITVFGEVPPGQALLRSGARPGDDIYVSGTLGDARLALGERWGEWHLAPAVHDMARLRMERPTPRVALGQALRGIASAAADISDGLLGDLGHILEQSGTGATIHTQIATTLIASCAHPALALAGLDARLSPQKLLECVLCGGDDYELVFTARPDAREAVLAASARGDVAVTRIGTIDAQPGVRLRDASGSLVPNTARSFDHFTG